MPNDEYQNIKIEREDAVTFLMLNRPEKRNAMSPALHYEMEDALSHLAKLASGSLGEWAGRAASDYAQRRAERLHARMRADLLRSDQWQMKTLAFSGKSE